MAVDGAYNVQMSSPMGTRPATITLKTDGNTLSGSVSGDLGTQTFDGGTVTGDDLEWSMQVSGPMGELKLDFKGTVSGDEISGQLQMGSLGSATFSGKRA